jgi:arylsulfatase
LDLSENTLILFTSDNGPTHDRVGGTDSDFFESSGPLRGRKGSVYEGGIRVPLIARWPGAIQAGRESDHVAAYWDVMPTLCEIAKTEVPPNLDGISFVPTLLGDADQAKHEFLYWEFPSYKMQQAVRAGNWKAVRSGVDQGDSAFELYDLSTDVGETRNVADEHPDVVKKITEIARAAHVPSKLFPLLAGEKRN